MKYHALADLFPLLEGEEFDALVQDIKANGQREAIWLYEDKILDGRNRWRACKAARVEPVTKQYRGKDPLGFVVSMNLHRRHLNESQRAMVAARVAKMRKGGDRRSENFKGPIELLKQKGAADALKVGRESVKRARIVLDKGTKELVSAVDAGKLPVSVAAKLAGQPEKKQRDVIKRVESGMKTTEALRQVRREELQEKDTSMPRGKYRVIYADPPWKYNDKCDEGSVQAGGAEKHYPSMSIGELCDLPISDMALQNSVLFLWVTSPLLEDAFEIIRAWGFSYKSSFVWDKVKHNMGHYNSVRHELLLVCVRGSCTPDNKKLFDSVQSIERTKHSEKPEQFRKIIDTLYTHGKKLELFARKNVSGWDCWGNENE